MGIEWRKADDLEGHLNKMFGNLYVNVQPEEDSRFRFRASQLDDRGEPLNYVLDVTLNYNELHEFGANCGREWKALMAALHLIS